jgi:hypothetical protein
MKKLRGLAQLVVDATVGGSQAVEKIQKRTVKRTVDVLSAIPVVGPVVGPPAHAVGLVHDACVGLTHVSIRGVTRAVGAGVDVALTVLEARAGAVPVADPPPEAGGGATVPASRDHP